MWVSDFLTSLWPLKLPGESCDQTFLPPWMEERLKCDWAKQKLVLMKEDLLRTYRSFFFTGESWCLSGVAMEMPPVLWLSSPSQSSPWTSCMPSPTALASSSSSAWMLCWGRLTTAGTTATLPCCCSTASPDIMGCPGSSEMVRLHLWSADNQ